MGEGFIVRKGGAVSEQALAPTITEVSKTDSEIVFTITNNDDETAVIIYEAADNTPDLYSVEIGAAQTSNNLIISDLNSNTEYTISATASVIGKTLSEVTLTAITTDIIRYTEATGGTTLEYDLDSKRYRSHTFTSNGTFTVTTVGNGDRNQVDYLVIGGGGGGPTTGIAGGGGGAGGYRTSRGPWQTGSLSIPESKVAIPVGSYNVFIGGGGAARPGADNVHGFNGGSSQIQFPTPIVAIGGAGGASGYGISGTPPTGGSGGGAGNFNGPRTGSFGTNGQGNKGGDAGDGSGWHGGGGGGAGEIGFKSVSDTNPGKGGAGLNNTIRTGLNEIRGGGGGGGGSNYTALNNGGLGGGGRGGRSGVTGANGATNTGGGAGGSYGNTAGGSGGSGIVIIAYEIAPTV
jgi:hypothetical protein